MKRLLPLAVFALVLAACEPSPPPKPVVTVRGPSSSWDVTVEIADNDQTRQFGLMERTFLAPDAGMLFVMDQPRVMEFWMKKTLIPLDIAFFDAGGRVIAMHTMPPCVADPCKTYSSNREALYALEVNAGKLKEKGVGTGWTLTPPSR